ncbi:MAG: DUF2017 family protein [Actinomycetota bacterium]
MSMRDPSILRRPDGRFDLDIPADQRDVLRGLPDQLRQLLADAEPETDEALRRLFPTADLDDPEHAAEFDRMVREDLLRQRAAAIEAMERTLDAVDLSEDELVGWLGVLNDLRLVLGTRLDVTEETEPDDFAPDDPRAHGYALYAYLTYLEDEIVQALSAD